MYDVRAMRSPSMQMVTAVAEWGAAPVRQKRIWAEPLRGLSCRAVVSFLSYRLCVCVLNLFGCPWYVMCLPVHKTVTLCPPVSGWEELNHSCKIIITAGLRFTLAKGVLSTFFLMCLGCGVHFCHLVAAVAKCRCPPVTKTYLMSDPDQPLDSAVLFEP